MSATQLPSSELGLPTCRRKAAENPVPAISSAASSQPASPRRKPRDQLLLQNVARFEIDKTWDLPPVSYTKSSRLGRARRCRTNWLLYLWVPSSHRSAGTQSGRRCCGLENYPRGSMLGRAANVVADPCGQQAWCRTEGIT